MDNGLLDLAMLPSDVNYRVILAKLLAYEDAILAQGGWHADGANDGRPRGWSWFEAKVSPVHLTPLVHEGIVSVVMDSDGHTTYRLVDVERVRRTLHYADADGPAQTNLAPISIPSDLFASIIGYEDVKEFLTRAVLAPRPVHVLLEGPPASAKTLFLKELARLPMSHVALGGTSTRAGLTEALLTYRPRILLIDEVETIDNGRDYSALLHLMENEEIVETKYGRHTRVPLRCRVFAAGNDAFRLPSALLSRFGGRRGVIRFRAYTTPEFFHVASNVLVEREGVSMEFAERVTTATLNFGSRDVRMAVRLARMARNEGDLAGLTETLRRRR